MIMNKTPVLLILIVGAFACNGCSIGKRSVLFSTKTSIGVDADTKPPTLDVGFSRKEGTLSPVYDNGQVHSQMASYASQSGFLNNRVATSFATGNAADILSQYIGEPNAKMANNDNAIIIPANPSSISGAANPKRYFFGTDTNFGVKIGMGLETGGWPDSINIGYKRKELAYVPIIEKNGKAGLPSLIGTSGFGVSGSQPGDAGVAQVQFFATGKAASHLAATPAIRGSLGLRILNDTEAKSLLEKERKRLEKLNQGLIDNKKKVEGYTSQIVDKVDALDSGKLDTAVDVAGKAGLLTTTQVTQLKAVVDIRKKSLTLKKLARNISKQTTVSPNDLIKLGVYRDELLNIK